LPSILIESAKIHTKSGITTAHILTENGVIKRISKLRPTQRADMTIDGHKLIALPGMIDPHVHLRDLELSYKETFETGTQAAAAGGFTTVLDMPNTRPPTITSQRLTDKISAAKGRLFANVAFQGALLDDLPEIERMKAAGAISFKLYMNKSLETFDSANQGSLRKALQAAKKSNVLVTIHAEEGESIQKIQQECISAGRTTIQDFLRAHHPQFEVSAVRRIINLTKSAGPRIHFCHITVPDAVKEITRTPNATCESTAHHLLLNESVFRKLRTLAMCVPPIRDEKIRRGLWRLFAGGQVDILASDHAPHTLDEKTKENAWDAATGVPGLETSLPMLFTQVRKRRLSLNRLIDATATLPSKIFGLKRKGALKEGYDADIVLVDPKHRFRVNPGNFLSKAKLSPFMGMECVGKAAYTIVNGTLVAERGRIVGPTAGMIIRGEGASTSY
jgi:dihydroorotase (multifunctional complex type)